MAGVMRQLLVVVVMLFVGLTRSVDDVNFDLVLRHIDLLKSQVQLLESRESVVISKLKSCCNNQGLLIKFDLIYTRHTEMAISHSDNHCAML